MKMLNWPAVAAAVARGDSVDGLADDETNDDDDDDGATAAIGVVSGTVELSIVADDAYKILFHPLSIPPP